MSSRNTLARAWHWIAEDLGLKSLGAAGKDTHIIILARSVRMFAYGAAAFVLALYFEALHISDFRIGLFMTLTLLGDVLISLLLTLIADRLGRRNILLLGSVMMACSGVVFASTGKYWLLLLAAIIGVISPSGGEIGPFRAVEESTLAHLVEASKRPDIFAWYVVFAAFGTSAGVLVGGGIVDHFRALDGWTDVDAYRVVFWTYAGIGVLKALLILLLSQECEVEEAKDMDQHGPAESGENESDPLLGSEDQSADNGESGKPTEKQSRNPFAHISTQSRWILLKLCALFCIDSVASGMVPFSLINFYMDRKFHLPKSKLGTVMSATWVMSTIGNIFASAIAKRIGLVKTMVFTHLPSAIFCALFPVPKSLAVTICLLIGRSTLASMDQAPRSAFLSAVVLANERTAVMGIVNVSKTLSQSVGPVITGALAGRDRFWIAFVVAGSMKAVYDVGLLTSFVNTKLHGHDAKADDGEPIARPSVDTESSGDDPSSDIERVEGAEFTPPGTATRLEQ